jgi:hypothetical protein
MISKAFIHYNRLESSTWNGAKWSEMKANGGKWRLKWSPMEAEWRLKWSPMEAN